MKKNIIVNLQFEAIHNWPRVAKESEVNFLQYPHRHTFYIEAKKEVTHNDRQIEIITFKRQILHYLFNRFQDGNLGDMSCEQLAEELLQVFGLSYCKVLEDNENGAEVIK